MKLSMKTLVAMFVAVLSVGVFFFTSQSNATTVDYSRDCDKYAVMYCGAMTKNEMVNKMNNGDTRNSGSNIRGIFGQFGLDVNDVKSANFKDGIVYQNGDVKVGGKVVAKYAQTYIRTLGGKGSTSRMGSAQAAKVALNEHGQFLFAVMTPCGNPVTGKNVVPKPPEPVAKCDSLKATKVERNKFSFTTAATAKNGAQITKYTYDFGDGNTKTTTNKTVNHTYSEAGTYTATVKVHFTIDGKSVSRTCKTSVTVHPEPKPEVPGVSIDKKVNNVDYTMVEIGEDFTYTLVVKNTGEVDLKEAVVSDEAPEGITFIETDKGQIVDNSLDYTISSLAVGGSETINITAVMEEYVEGKVVNTACVETPTVPGGNPDDCDDATVKTEEPKVEVCDLTTGEIVTVTKTEAEDERYTTDLSQCEEEPKKVEVCDTTTGKIIMVDEGEADDERYVGVNDEACNPPVKGDVTELPKTGLVQTLSSFFGLGSLAAATSYYISSRRS